ncbi:hypothetical protein A5730_12240 [Mycobacterium sp. ACS4054]|uniref:DUF6629 family protein n=1 Tax=Mycobacterium sp. ACS4054 TaxID=1834119 RepID=UPI0008013FB9|nr:DUF6629 family protein [Mycobacterium sp. ACS4054]OBF07598.1 hypothetical protein A5730_12240 [Mycobacterium sp. ACS4054]
MCFSITADLVVGTALVPVAVASLREVKHWREVPFASLPAVFSVHQFLEAAVWPNRVVSAGFANFAMHAYVFIALPVLPLLVPVAILMLEPRGARLRVAPFAVLGAVVSAYLAVVVLAKPVGVTRCPHVLEYQTASRDSYLWAVLYILAVIGPALMSGYRSIVVFGLANLVGLVLVAMFYFEAFASVWCIYAAVMSVLVLVHMVRRRRMPDPHRYRGVGPDRPVPVRS